jgi:dihydrodipicolinate synthase/N-acetylneuraminate lyase
VPVLIGTGGTNARETIELSQHAQQAGADGIVVINPYYWKVSEAQPDSLFPAGGRQRHAAGDAV